MEFCLRSWERCLQGSCSAWLAAAYLTSGQAGKAVAVLGLLAFFVACAGAWYGVLGRREEDSYRLFPDLGIGINGLLLVGFVMIYIMGW